jgi:hypothetical protein
MHLLRAGWRSCGFTNASAGWLMGSLWAKLNELGLLIGPTRLYASAVVELDHKRLIERVEATEAAIHGRLRDLQYIVTTMKSVS